MSQSGELHKRAARATWQHNPAGWSHAPDATVGSRSFFDRVVRERFEHEIPFICELIPFASFAGRRVLEVGCGAGYDALKICEGGAAYTGIDLAPANPARLRTHLAERGFAPRALCADAEKLPFPSASFDVVFSNGVLHHTPDIAAALREIRRVLAPGGELWLVLYHRDSAFFWLHVVLSRFLLHGGFLRGPLRRQMSRIESTGSDAEPLVRVYGRRGATALLEAANLRVEESWIRKLQGHDMPGYRVLRHVYPHVPRAWKRFAERRFGWYLTLRATRTDD